MTLYHDQFNVAVLIVGLALTALACAIIHIGAKRESRRPYQPAFGRADVPMGTLVALAVLGAVVCFLWVYADEHSP